MTAAVTAAIVLLSAGCGFCIGVLWVLRSRRLTERDERQRLWIAERTTRAAIDLATFNGITLEQAEQAILKAMQMSPSGPPLTKRYPGWRNDLDA